MIENITVQQLLDDLLWLHAGPRAVDGLQETADAMVDNYTNDPNRYSDGSVVWEDWTDDNPPGYSPPNPRAALHLPPHRRTEELAKHLFGHGFLGPMRFEPAGANPGFDRYDTHGNPVCRPADTTEK